MVSHHNVVKKVLLYFAVDVARAVGCYVCNRVTILYYNGTDKTAVDTALSTALEGVGMVSDFNCMDGVRLL